MNKVENMLYNELLAKLIYLTKRNNITHKEIGSAIAVERHAMSGRADRNSKFKPEEVEQIEKSFRVKFNDMHISSNTLELKDTQFKEHPTLGHRLTQIQEENGFQNKAMAKFMQIDESRYRHIVSGDISPTAQELLNLASKIDVSLDWLIKG